MPVFHYTQRNISTFGKLHFFLPLGDLESKTVDGVNIVHLFNNSVFLTNSSKEIKGLKNFTGQVSIDDYLVLPGVATINQILPSDLIEVYSNKTLIEGQIIIQSIFVDTLGVINGGTINNVEFTEFYTNSLKYGEGPFLLNEDQTFSKELIIYGKLIKK